jgi:hypothetical protein
VFDLVLDTGDIVAIYEDGTVGFVSVSSGGETYVDGGESVPYVTTIFSLTCNGVLQFGITGGTAYEFYRLSDDDPFIHARAVPS